jgi:hypothetical protein
MTVYADTQDFLGVLLTYSWNAGAAGQSTQQISSKSLIPHNLNGSVRDFKTPTT